MKRRTFVLGIGSASIGGSALLGSGAFSRVESQRAVTIEVAEDPDAYLGMDGCPDSANSSYTNIDENGHLEVDMTPGNPTDAGGEGVNSDSRTWFDRVFQLCNQGKERVCVYIEDDEDWPRVDDEQFPEEDFSAYDGDRRVEFYLETVRERSVIGEDQAITLDTGECACISIRTLTKGLSEDDVLLDALDNTVTIVADTDLTCAPVEIEETYEAFQVDLAWGDPLPVIDSDESVTYSNQSRLLAWQHGDGDPNAAPSLLDWEDENGNRFGHGGATLGFARLFESMDVIRFRNENGDTVTETDGSGNVSQFAASPDPTTPVEAEIEFTMVEDFEQQKNDLEDDLEDQYENNEITEAAYKRATDALNGGVDVSFTAYGGSDFGWNPPEFQVLFDSTMTVSSNGTYTLEVDLPPLE